jgi:EAL domain-containing protein (putative c-di-GMP-specific phosphodiesterase class I)
MLSGATEDIAAAMKNADLALYQAKANGRGAFCYFDPSMNDSLQARRALELDLRLALSLDQFELFYQPLVGIASGQVSGFEALLRWRHPTRGLIPPLEFIPICEETGMIHKIGAWVIDRACRDAKQWPGDLNVAVNLSAVQFKNADLVNVVSSALAASGLPAQRLELEITESVLLVDSEATLAILHKLRALDLRISMDDFGTGYSSLSYLQSFPFDKIKIDQSFVRNLTGTGESVAIIRAVTGLSRSLGIATVAEGVETHEQLKLLRGEACTEVQGYLFGRPCPVADIPQLLNDLTIWQRT